MYGPQPQVSKANSLTSYSGFRTIVYHAGMPRVMFLGALKLTSTLILGFFTAVTIPASIEAGAPLWYIAGCSFAQTLFCPAVPDLRTTCASPASSLADALPAIAASVTPMVAFWLLFSPMVMWIHLTVPETCLRDPKQLDRFIGRISSAAEINITTMGALGNRRLSTTTLAQLRPEKRRFGLVNYVRDVTRENAERKWYAFPAVGEFKVDTGIIKPKLAGRTDSAKVSLWEVIQAKLKENTASQEALRR